MFVFYFVHSVLFCYFVYCSPFVYSCLLPIFVPVYWPLSLGGIPIAVINVKSYFIALRSSLLCNVTQRRLVVSHRRFGTTYRPNFKDQTVQAAIN